MDNNSKFITIETTRVNQQSLQEDVQNGEFLKNIINALA